jgi:hypothetical protein
MAITKEQFARLTAEERGKEIDRLLKERTFQIARAELSPDQINLPIPENLDDIERATNELLSKAKKGSIVYKLLNLQIRSIKQTRRFRRQMEKFKAMEKRLKDKAQKHGR